jgi:hypothetical protein
VVQYGQYEMTAPGIMPFPITIARPHDRVTEENAPVTVLDAGARAFQFPNRITTADYEGWVQERALYMPRTFDAAYHPLLAMNDSGEQPNRGAILLTPYGKGNVRLHDACLLPSAACGSQRRCTTVRQSSFSEGIREQMKRWPAVALLLLSALSCSSDKRTVLIVYSPHGKELLEYLEKGFEKAHPEHRRPVGRHGVAGSTRPCACGERTIRRLMCGSVRPAEAFRPRHA